MNIRRTIFSLSVFIQTSNIPSDKCKPPRKSLSRAPGLSGESGQFSLFPPRWQAVVLCCLGAGEAGAAAPPLRRETSHMSSTGKLQPSTAFTPSKTTVFTLQNLTMKQDKSNLIGKGCYVDCCSNAQWRRGDEVGLVASEQLWCWGQGRPGLGTQLVGRGAAAAGLDTNCQIIRRVAVTPAQRGGVAGRCWSRCHVLPRQLFPPPTHN